MAKKPNIAAVASLNLVALAAIVAAGEGGTYGTEADLRPLSDAGFVEVNGDNTNDAGEFAVRATAAGIAKAAEEAPTPATATKSNFAVADVPADIMTAANEKRRATRGGGEKYPFDALEVGKGFFVEATAKMPEPAKSLASTVSSATSRYAEETEETKMVNVKTYQKDAEGKRVKDAEGHFVVESEEEVEKAVMANTRVFKLVPAENGAWVVRTA